MRGRFLIQAAPHVDLESKNPLDRHALPAQTPFGGQKQSRTPGSRSSMLLMLDMVDMSK